MILIKITSWFLIILVNPLSVEVMGALSSERTFSKSEIFDGMICAEASLKSYENARGRLECSTLCSKDATGCASFFYNHNTRACKGYEETLMTTGSCQIEPGSVYFTDTSKMIVKMARVRAGPTTLGVRAGPTTLETTSCLDNGDCSMVLNTQCSTSGMCQCEAGFLYYPSNDDCIISSSCMSYDIGFSRYETMLTCPPASISYQSSEYMCKTACIDTAGTALKYNAGTYDCTIFTCIPLPMYWGGTNAPNYVLVRHCAVV